MLLFSLCCCQIWYLLETWGRIFGLLILRLIVVFVLLYFAWLCAGWMRVRIGWFATSQLRQQHCVRHSFSPRITALNLMRSHQCNSQSKLQRTGFGHRVRKSRRSWRGGCQSSKLAFRTRNRKSLASV